LFRSLFASTLQELATDADKCIETSTELQEGQSMQVLCKLSNTVTDVRCKICGQGFLIYWARTAPSEQDNVRRLIVEALSQQHTASNAGHPRNGFALSGWPGSPNINGNLAPSLQLAAGASSRTV
jgi:hypothetical protein